MTTDVISQIVLISTATLLIAGMVILIARRKGSVNFASLTAYHDFQPKDKQEAVEIVMEKKAGKKMVEEESGEGWKKEYRI